MSKKPRIAIVCDFLTTMGGAENVVLALHEAFSDAPIYTAVYNPDKMPAFAKINVRTSRLQNLPKKLRNYHKLLPTMAVKAMRELDLSEFDIIITSSYLHGHQVTKTRSDQVIINYCHTPPRYYWSHYDEYRRDPGYGKLNPIVRALMPLMVPRQRKLDLEAAANVDIFLANSTETQARIKKYYNRSSTVIHPPVETKRFTPQRTRGNHYVTIGRQLPYKRYDLAVQAASKLNIPLIVFGNGPAHDKLVKMAGPTVEFRTDRFGDASDKEYEKAITSAKGFIYPAEEDFGIVTVEALAAGAPVIGYGKAGTLDIVQNGISGVLFDEQSPEAVAHAIQKAEKMTFMPATLQRKAKRFEKSLFITKIRKIVQDNLPNSQKGI
ncbi:glycosyltransferase family 4 protein [Candidatus Saccharibacteria bacterium]|nr:glycosyltransferase family 4 protein [Candidatus Saccharibacteria bacterium]